MDGQELLGGVRLLLVRRSRWDRLDGPVEKAGLGCICRCRSGGCTLLGGSCEREWDRVEVEMSECVL